MIQLKLFQNIFSNRWKYHSLFWLSIFLFIVFVAFPSRPDFSLIFKLTFSFSLVALSATATYLHFYTYDKFFSKKQYLLYTISVISIWLICSFMMMLFFKTFFDVKNSFAQWLVDILFVLIITSAIKFVKQGIEQRYLIHKVEAKNLQMELDLLKSQVNPHFFFNTLNSLYSLALGSDNKILADSIANLSNLMRYMIYESREKFVLLSKEIEIIKRYIELQKLRFSDEDKIIINFNFTDDNENFEIAPMLLIPLVENAFKHGISLEENSHIDIKLTTDAKGFSFSIKNIIHPSKRVEASGIGLSNVERRLELLYPDTHKLDIDSDDTYFSVKLKVTTEN